MQTVAEQVAAALMGAQLRDESAKRASRLEVTVAVAEAVAGATGVEPTLRAAATTISRLIACGAVTAYVAEPETGEQVALVDVDLHDGSVEGMRRPLYAHTTGQVFRRRNWPIFFGRSTASRMRATASPVVSG